MMAKMFYTLEEAKAALGRSEEEVKQFAREGRLREFRDGPRLMFKADQVEQLKSEMGAGTIDIVDLGTSDSGGLIGLVDTTGASGTSITLSDADTGQSSQVGMRMKDDTALAADLGLSGSLGGVPSPGRPMASGTGLSGTAVGRQGGINVFGSDDLGEADPSAQTAISGSVREQINLEGVGSGSGLLDLTRESDDTSLGAVLDEIAPSGTRLTSPGDPSDGGMDLGDTRAARGGFAGPVFVQAHDPSAVAFGLASLAGGLVMLFGLAVVIASLNGVWPEWVRYFKDRNDHGLTFVGIGLGLALLLFVIGLIFGKSSARA